MLTPTWRQKLVRRKSIIKYSDDSVKEDTGDNSLGDNLLGDDPLGDGSSVHIDSNINMDTEAKSNPDEDMTDDNLLEENSGINIEDLFQQVRDQTACKRLTRDVLEQTCSFFQHLINKISLSDRVPIRSLKCGLRLFQALGVYYIFAVEVTTMSGGILADDMGLGKVKYLLFHI